MKKTKLASIFIALTVFMSVGTNTTFNTAATVSASSTKKKSSKKHKEDNYYGFEIVPHEADTPVIKKFTRKILNKYVLEGWRCVSTTITYYDNANSEYKPLVNKCIAMINDLGIVKLVRSTKKKAQITIEMVYYEKDYNRMEEDILGLCNREGSGMPEYKGLKELYGAQVYIYVDRMFCSMYRGGPSESINEKAIMKKDRKLPDSVTEPKERNIAIYEVEQTLCHEIGHALGLDDDYTNSGKTMSGYSMFAYSGNDFYSMDQTYRDRLAVLYEN